jgi:hypothetical protein
VESRAIGPGANAPKSKSSDARLSTPSRLMRGIFDRDKPRSRKKRAGPINAGARDIETGPRARCDGRNRLEGDRPKRIGDGLVMSR